MSKPVVKSMLVLAEEYRDMVSRSDAVCLDLGAWLPSLRDSVRPLVPGELCFIMADTGVGKSMALQNISMSTSETTLFFEMELPGALLYERYMAISNKLTAHEVEQRVKRGDFLPPNGADNIFVCDATRMSKDGMKAIIEEFAKENGYKPFVVMVDYIGLMQAEGRSRYERTSASAEDLKVLAKETNTVVIAATQVSRDSERTELDIHDAKESGSIENSAGVLIALWRDDNAADILWLKILKNTKGRSGACVKCNIDGARMTITECADMAGRNSAGDSELERPAWYQDEESPR